MLPGMDSLPPLNLSGGDAHGGRIEFGGVHIASPQSQGPSVALIAAGVAVAYLLLRGR